MIVQFQSGVFLVTEGSRMHLITSAFALTPSLHLVRFAASSTSNPILFALSSTCLLHLCFGLPRFRCLFTSSINALFRMSSFLTLTEKLTTQHVKLYFCREAFETMKMIKNLAGSGNEVYVKECFGIGRCLFLNYVVNVTLI